MNKSKAKRIQYLLTTHLLSCGTIQLALPDGVVLEIGITRDTKHGREISNDYCFVKASRKGNATLLDTYNVGLQYVDANNAIVCLDTFLNDQGQQIKHLEVV